jgi:hypothetical protein
MSEYLSTTLPRLVQEIENELYDLNAYRLACLIVDVCLNTFKVSNDNQSRYWYLTNSESVRYRIITQNDIRRFIDNNLYNALSRLQSKYLSECDNNKCETNQRKVYKLAEVTLIVREKLYKEFIDCYNNRYFD